jgi:hypothetical protein
MSRKIDELHKKHVGQALEGRKYRRGERAKDDRQQTVLCPDGIAPNPHHFAVKTEVLLPLESKATCPFCLAETSFNRFLVSDRKGISHSKGKCPACERGMLLKSLARMQSFSAEQYAEWVFEYPGFWRIISSHYSTWRNRLGLMGWTNEFWNRYKLLKEERVLSRPEGYEDYMNRKAQEEQQEWARSQEQPQAQESYGLER